MEKRSPAEEGVTKLARSGVSLREKGFRGKDIGRFEKGGPFVEGLSPERKKEGELLIKISQKKRESFSLQCARKRKGGLNHLRVGLGS